ncbi:MAG: extracellular solute-binding protein [bacterium]|nr:extracellular solute-binding protein [bacterium]
MKISLFQGIVTGIFAVAALIGLYVFATYTSTGGENAIGAVTVWGTLPAADLSAGLLAATEDERSLKSVTYIEKAAATLPSDLASAIATSGAPDLVLASQEELLALAPFLAPIPFATLSARTFASSFAEEGALFTVPDGGGYYGVPLLIDPIVLFYNRAILASSGIATPPSTWEALTGLVPKVATLTTSRGVTRGLIALGTYDNVHDARGILSTLFLQTATPLSARAATGVISADLGLAPPGGGGTPPGQAVVRFYTQFTDPTKVSYTWNASLPDSQSAFEIGDLALYLGFVSEARYLAAAAPNLDFDVVPVPQPATAPNKTTYGLAYAFMIPTGAKNPSGAYAAAVLLTHVPAQLALARVTGLAPASRAALAAQVPADPVAATASASALYAAGWLSPLPTDTDAVFSAMIGNVISGRYVLGEALATAERSLSALLRH